MEKQANRKGGGRKLKNALVAMIDGQFRLGRDIAAAKRRRALLGYEGPGLPPVMRKAR